MTASSGKSRRSEIETLGEIGGFGKFGDAQFRDARNDKIGNGAEPAFSIYFGLLY